MRRVMFLIAIVSATAPQTVPAPAQTTQLTIVQVAVRQGDAAVIQGPCGELGLIDTNRFRGDEVLAVLDSLGTRTLEWTSVSHYDADHLGGLVGVATAPGVSVERAYDRGGPRTEHNTDTYRNYFDWATSPATTRMPVDIGDSFTLCSGDQTVTLSVVSAGTDGTAAGGVTVTEENDKGLCLKVTYVEFDFATCGDVNGTDEGSRTDVETAVSPSFGEVDFAKINHHGSAFSSNATFVDTLSPEAAVVSTGANGFGHPDPAVLQRWLAHGDVYQTQDDNNDPVDGNVTVTTTGTSSFTITTSSSGITRSYALEGSGRCPGFESVAGNHVVGTAVAETLDGTTGRDVICGLGGGDTLIAWGGHDLLLGGRGRDDLRGGSGRDLLNGGAGSDRCREGPGRDTQRACER
jgi:beta-lactamase superfamily II metal-dependent hydrolase